MTRETRDTTRRSGARRANEWDDWDKWRESETSDTWRDWTDPHAAYGVRHGRAARQSTRGPNRRADGQHSRGQHSRGARRARRRSRRWLLPLVTVITAVAAGASLWLIRVALAGMLATLLGSANANAGIAQRVPTPVPTPTPRPPLAPVPVGVFDTRQFSDVAGNSMTYYLYAPASYTPSGHYPLVLVLHGGGEVADPQATAQHNRDVLLNQAYVQAFTMAQEQQKWPCFVVAPQAPAGQRWVNVPPTVSSYTLAPQPSRSLGLAFEIVQSLEQTYPMIDVNRIYVEGISMGGFGTWEAAERWPTTFAAALPISGAGDPHAAVALVHVPIWAFHGALDDVVPVQASRLMVQAIQAAGGTPCYTEYPNDGHGIWDDQHVFGDQQVYAWLFSQTRAPSATAVPLGCPAPSG